MRQASSYRNVCEYCGERGLTGNNTKALHYREKHPEIQFTMHKRRSEGGSQKDYVNYSCALCQYPSKWCSFILLVRHYKNRHHGVLVGDPAAAPPPTPIHKASEATTEITIDGFFNQLGEVLEEVKQLRIEKREWQLKATRWSARIVELQELMVRKQ